MADSPIARSPLADLGTPVADPALSLSELAFSGFVDLRLGRSDAVARAAVAQTLGLALPDANRETRGVRRSLLWLGPDEYLAVTEPGGETAIIAALAAALRGRHVAVTDLSDSRTTIVATGRHARDLLAKGSGLDLHPRAFATGHCAQSFLAKARIALRQIDDAPTYHVIVERSLAEYLYLWLADAAAEFVARPA